MATSVLRHAGLRAPALRASVRSASSLMYPLQEEYPGVPPPKPVALPIPTPQVTTLDNGLKVASIDTNDMATTLSIVVGMGTRNEGAISGACHLLKYAAYGSTENRTALRLVRDLEEAGASFGVAHGRETFALTAKCMRNKLSGVADTMAESLRMPTMKIWELRERANGMIDDQTENAGNMEDALHAAAFYDSETLGVPLYGQRPMLYDAEELQSFRGAFLVPSNMVVVGTAAAHQDLVKVAQQQFGDMAAAEAPANGAAEYVGGETRIAAAGPTQVGLVFPCADASAGGVLAEVLGAGQAVRKCRSIGGGNTSRLAKLVEESGILASADGVTFTHSDAALVGLVATAAKGASSQAVFESMVATFKGVAAGVDEEECARAKSRLKGKLLAELECGASLAQSMAAEVLATGKYRTIAEQLAAIDAVSAAQVSGTAAAALKASPACATVGDIASMPRYNKLAAMCK